MHEVSRRAVIGAGMVGGAVVGAVLADPTAAFAAPGSQPLRSHYATSVGKVFSVEHRGVRTRARLTRVHDLSGATADQRRYRFLLVFAPTGTKSLDDAIYTVRRRGVPSHQIFLSSIGPERDVQAVVDGPEA
jgi:hypothetical protein